MHVILILSSYRTHDKNYAITIMYPSKKSFKNKNILQDSCKIPASVLQGPCKMQDKWAFSCKNVQVLQDTLV